MKPKSKKRKAEASFPKSRVLQFEKESFLCDNGGHDCGVVYLYRGRWLCGRCLKDAVRANGGTSVEVYSAVWRAECRMIAGNMRCLTQKVERQQLYSHVVKARKRLRNVRESEGLL